MEVILKFIGIILLVANPETNPTTYDVYIQDARVPKRVCCKDRMKHFPAIRVRVSNVKSTWWKKPIECTDGPNCQLFELKHGRIEIDGITNGGGRVKTGTIKQIPHFRDKLGVQALINVADREAISAGWLTLMNGTLTDDAYTGNKMPYAVLTVPLSFRPVTIKSGNDSITIPAQTEGLEIDFIDLPEDFAKGDLNAPTSDEGHFEWHYRYAARDYETCQPVVVKSGNADCSATTWP